MHKRAGIAKGWHYSYFGTGAACSAGLFYPLGIYVFYDVYLSVVSGADELWHLTDRVCVSFRDSMKRAVLTKLGMYMTDECFAHAEEYLKTSCGSVYWGVSEEYFECLYRNINRLNPTVVTDILTEIIRELHFHKKSGNTFHRKEAA